MGDTTVENIACIHCSVAPSMGVGPGRMGESCPACIPLVQTKGICPICCADLGADANVAEHMGGCKGKPPRVPKKKAHVPLPDDGRSLEQIAKDAAAQASMEKRRDEKKAATALRDAALAEMTPEQRAAFKKKMATDPEGVMPTDRCGTCNTFLDDAKRCANDECADRGKKTWGN